MKETVFAFMYCPCVHESAWATVSLHRTRKGAEIAMEFHKAEALKEFNSDYTAEEIEKLGFKFGQFEDWCVEELEIEE